MADTSRIVVASNRGPVTFVREPDGSVTGKRGVGGLVTAVGGAVRGRDALWVAATITDEDRAQAAEGPVSIELGSGATVRVRLVPVEPDRYEAYYNEVSNRILWFLHHYLWDAAHTPEFGEEDESNWEAYREIGERFADTVARDAPADAAVLTQDYHLSLLPGALRARRTDLGIAHFMHIPFCQPDQYHLLPDAWGRALLEGMLAADVVGFHTERWAANFLACCREVLGARVRGKTVTHGDRTTRVGVFPIGVSPDELRERVASPAVKDARVRLDEIVGDRALILRVDRTEPSKNILRGFIAYESLLSWRPDLHGQVVHVARLTPSRRDVPEYQAYMAACGERAQRINERFGTPSWTPVVLEVEDDFDHTLAAYTRYDVLLVNPVYDGMNLVAREAPLCNERDGALVLSRNAGAWAELAPAAITVNPWDTRGTARALETALEMDAAQRAETMQRLRPLAAGTAPDRWLEAQVSLLRRARAT